MRAPPGSHVALTVLIAVLPAITSLLVSPALQPQPCVSVHRWQHQQFTTGIAPRCQSRLRMSNVEIDPFAVLNLPPPADKEEIKRTYRRMALKYHPDVVTDRNASAEERRKANDAFAQINWAYAQLSCTYEDSIKTKSTSISTRSSPPLRRTSNFSENPNQWASAAYHAGGDSFVSLEDLFKGAAISAARAAWGGAGRSHELRFSTHDNPNHASSSWRDYMSLFEGDVVSTQDLAAAAAGSGIPYGSVKVLEHYVDGSSACEKEGFQLQILLETGSAKDVGMEMDYTDLVVQQLDNEMKNLEDELEIRQANRMIASTTYLYLEKREWDENMAELEKRTQVVDEKLKKARTRLLALQTRYNQLDI